VTTREIDDPTLLAALELNNAHAIDLSFQTEAAFRRLLSVAFYRRWTAQQEAFLIALDQDAASGSENFLWFRARHARFVYVDRVVVRPEHRGKGHGRDLYEDLFALARAAGHDRVVCEVNQVPPNPASDAFHARFGFRAVGGAALLGAPKVVRYLMRAPL
jgi:predicted GNAT superfamily acetyltransferase